MTRTIEHVTHTARPVSLEYLADEIATTLLAKSGNVPRVTVTLAQTTPLARAEVHVTRAKDIPPNHVAAAPYVLQPPTDIAKLGSTSQNSPQATHRTILGVGSNINDRVDTINRALALLAQLGTVVKYVTLHLFTF